MVENLGCPKNDSIIASKASTVVENCQKMPLKLEWPQWPLMTSTGLKDSKWTQWPLMASMTSIMRLFWLILKQCNLVVKLDGVSHLLSRLWDVHLIRLFDMLVISIMNAVSSFMALQFWFLRKCKFSCSSSSRFLLLCTLFLSMKSNLSWFCNFLWRKSLRFSTTLKKK